MNPKVLNSSLAGAVTVLIIFFVGLFASDVEIPATVSAAITVVISSLFGYFTSEPDGFGNEGEKSSGNTGVF